MLLLVIVCLKSTASVSLNITKYRHTGTQFCITILFIVTHNCSESKPKPNNFHDTGTPSKGQCGGGARPGDASGCTWRALAPPDIIETECLRDKLADALASADPSCFTTCPPGDRWTDCSYRCYWLALNRDPIEAKTIWTTIVRPAFEAAWQSRPPAGCLQ